MTGATLLERLQAAIKVAGRMPPTPQRVLVGLAYHAESFRPSVAQIGAVASVEERNAREALRWLEAHGVILGAEQRTPRGATLAKSYAVQYERLDTWEECGADCSACARVAESSKRYRLRHAPPGSSDPPPSGSGDPGPPGQATRPHKEIHKEDHMEEDREGQAPSSSSGDAWLSEASARLQAEPPPRPASPSPARDTSRRASGDSSVETWSDEHRAVYATWRKHHKRAPESCPEANRPRIRAMVKEFGRAQVELVIDWAHQGDDDRALFLQGKAPGRPPTPYLGLDTLLVKDKMLNRIELAAAWRERSDGRGIERASPRPAAPPAPMSTRQARKDAALAELLQDLDDGGDSP